MKDVFGSAVVSVGSVNADFQMRVEDPPDTGQVRLARDFARLGGGKAANVAYMARRLGVPAQLHGRVGDDSLRDQALHPLRAIDADLTGVTVAEGCSTGVAVVTVFPDGKKTILFSENANAVWSDGALQAAESAVRDAAQGSVLVCDYEIPASVVRRMIDAAAARRMPVIVDPSPTQRVERSALAGVTAVTPNASEAEDLTGIAVGDTTTAAKAARRITEGGARIACVKLSGGGCVVAEDGQVTAVPPISVRKVDSTGAGDAFAAGLAVGLLEGRSVTDAACLATAGAALAVTAYGAQPSYPAREQIEALLPRLARQLHAA